ncbi:MAG: hypothetical protein LBE16_05045, partial [Clostridiales Family XIII bacterium]|nr:hypothetical protein [Clostridiales Family XIII bacterium]
TDAYVLRGGGRSPCPLKTSVQQLKCAFGASILDGAKIETARGKGLLLQSTKKVQKMRKFLPIFSIDKTRPRVI